MLAPRTLSIRDSLKGIQAALEEHQSLIIRITVLFAVLATVSQLLDLTGPAGIAVSVGFLLLLGSAYGGLVTALVCLPGNPDSGSELWQAVKPVLAALIWLTIVYAVAVALGALLLVIPGLIIATIWAVGGQVVVVERLGVFQALSRSAALVKGNGFAVFGYLVVLALIVLLLTALVVLVTLPLATGGFAYKLIFPLLSNLVTAPLYAVGLAALYNELNGRGVNPKPLVDQPEPEE